MRSSLGPQDPDQQDRDERGGQHIGGDHREDQLLIDHHDSRFTSGRVGLWTKADSITAFDDLVVSPIDRG